MHQVPVVSNLSDTHLWGDHAHRQQLRLCAQVQARPAAGLPTGAAAAGCTVPVSSRQRAQADAFHVVD